MYGLASMTSAEADAFRAAREAHVSKSEKRNKRKRRAFEACGHLCPSDHRREEARAQAGPGGEEAPAQAGPGRAQGE